MTDWGSDESRAAYFKEYRSRPEVRERYRLQQREYRQKHQEELAAYRKDYYKIWNAENPDKVKTYQLTYRVRLRQGAIQLLGGKCVRCGLDDIRVLQADHIFGGGRKEAKILGGSLGIYRKILKMAFPDTEYQCLCANHNWIKRAEDYDSQPPKTKQVKYQRKLRNRVLEKLGNRCASPTCCWVNEDGTLGCKDSRALQVDHVNGGGTQESLSMKCRAQLYWKVLSDIEGQYQLLCANCNWIKRYVNGEC